jgi:ATP:corrinoid adenosyltransferase
MIKEEELNEWISEFYPTVETEIIEVLRTRVQYAILDELNYMVSNQIATTDEVKKIVLDEIMEITNDSIEIDIEED